MHRIPFPSTSCQRYLALAIALLAFVSVGCRPLAFAPNEPASPEVRSAVHSATAKPSKSPWQATTVVDRIGHSITLEHAPQRIVSLLPSATELLFAIGAGQSIVGATKHCNFPAEALEIPRVGSGLLEGTSREAILALKPDLVLCKWDTHEPLTALFDRVQIPALNLGAETLEELFVEAKLLGRVTGHDQGAEAFIKRMKDRREQLMQRVATLDDSQQRTVFYEVWDDPLMTVGPKSFIGELLKMGRMKNIFDDTEVPYPRISSEVVVARNPDVILAPSSHAQQVEPATLASRPGWSNIRAVTKHQIYAIDGDEVSRCGPRMLNALEQMIDAVYPETKLKDPSTP
jgi:iron complex transport system substrate-binding protein